MKNLAHVLIALMLGWAAAANAAVIYSNGPIASNGFVSDTDFPPSGVFVADDFSLATGANVITGVQWTGLYAFANTPQPDIFTIQFFADSGGAPVLAPFLSLAIGNPGRTDTGINVAGSDLFAYSVNVAPISLTPNTVFWLSIFNNTSADINDNWFWGMQDAAGNSFSRSSAAVAWSPQVAGNRQDFQLTGPTAVPEPSALALFAIGVFGLLGWRRKQAR